MSLRTELNRLKKGLDRQRWLDAAIEAELRRLGITADQVDVEALLRGDDDFIRPRPPETSPTTEIDNVRP